MYITKKHKEYKMTTVVWSKGVLAADGRCTAGNRISSETKQKIYPVESGVVRGSPVICFALAGAADMFDRVGEWITEGCPVTDDFKDTGFSTIIVTKDEAYYYTSESNDLYELGDDESETIGSGGEFAVSALAFGKNAIEAVRHAGSIDLFTGGTGCYINCRAEKLELREFKV